MAGMRIEVKVLADARAFQEQCDKKAGLVGEEGFDVSVTYGDCLATFQVDNQGRIIAVFRI